MSADEAIDAVSKSNGTHHLHRANLIKSAALNRLPLLVRNDQIQLINKNPELRSFQKVELQNSIAAPSVVYRTY